MTAVLPDTTSGRLCVLGSRMGSVSQEVSRMTKVNVSHSRSRQGDSESPSTALADRDRCGDRRQHGVGRHEQRGAKRLRLGGCTPFADSYGDEVESMPISNSFCGACWRMVSSRCLKKPSPTSSARSRRRASAVLRMRFAVRPEGVDGWRPWGSRRTTLSVTGRSTRAANLGLPCTPRRHRPTNKTRTSSIAAVKRPACNKATIHGHEPPALADAYGKSSRTTPVDDAEEDCLPRNAASRAADCSGSKQTEAFANDTAADDDELADEIESSEPPAEESKRQTQASRPNSTKETV